MTKITLRHLTDAELAAAGWSTGEIRELHKYLAKGATNAHQRRICQRYQALRRAVVAAETEAAAKAAKRAERYSRTVYTLEQLDLIPCPEARERALKLVALWEFTDGGVVPFPGVSADVDLHDPDGKINYYLCPVGFTVDMPPMHASAGRLTQRVEKVFGPQGPGTYRYCTVTLRTALGRAMRGQDLFAWGVER